MSASPPRRFVILDDDATQRRRQGRAIEAAGGVVVASVDKVAAAGRAVSISSPDALVCRLRSCGTPCTLHRGAPRFAHEEARATAMCPAIGTVRVVENLALAHSDNDAAAVKAVAAIRWPEPQTPPPGNKWPTPALPTPPPSRARPLFPLLQGLPPLPASSSSPVVTRVERPPA